MVDVVRKVQCRALFVLPRVIIVMICLSFTILFCPTTVHAAIPTTMNFQGRLADTSGNIVADGLYNMQFKIYSVSTGGTALWSEIRQVNGTDYRVQVTNGLFSTQLGQATALTANLFTNTDLYFEITLANPLTATCNTTGCQTWESPMTTRQKLATSAYAYNSDLFDGLDSTAFAQLSSSNSWTGANSMNVASTSALSVMNGATSLFKVDTTNSQVVIGQSDSTGAVLVLDTKSDNSSDPTGGSAIAGAMYYNSTLGKFRCYQNTGWADCITAVGGGVTLQQAYDNSTSPATITTTANKGVKLSPGAVPTQDIFSVDNTGQAVATDNVDGIGVTYIGGNAAGGASGIKVDYTSGSTSSSTWSGLHVAASTGAASGVNSYGLRVDGPGTPGSGNEVGVSIGAGWDSGLDVQSGGINLAALSSEPTAPAAGNLKVYSKSVAGRMMLKWKAPSGADTPLQTNLGFNNVSLWAPATGTTAVGTGFGTTWPAVTGTITHPTVASTNIGTSIKAMQSANVVTTQNQILGLTASTATLANTWRGNAAGLGGFFMHTRFKTNLVPAATVRLFVGLSAMTTGVAAANSVSADTVGLSHYTTDNITTMTFMTYDNSTPTRTVITVPTIASGNAYDFTMYAPPNGSVIYYRLVDLLSGTILADTSTSTTLPRNTVFMGPQVQMSNGTANTTATTTAIGISRIYLESDN